MWKEFSLCSSHTQFFGAGVFPGKMGDHYRKKNNQLLKLEQNPFHTHHFYSQAKLFREYLALFLEVCVFSQFTLQEVIERHKNGVLGLPGPFACAFHCLIVLEIDKSLLRLSEITSSIVLLVPLPC